MKVFKKTLILASTLALGFTLAGCSKKNVLIEKKYNIGSLNNYEYTKYSNLEKTFEMNVKSFTRIYDNLVWYETTANEFVIYDADARKEIFKTTDKIRSVTQYLSGRIIRIDYDDADNNQELIATNGDVFAIKGKYKKLSASYIVEETKNKNGIYSETIVRINVQAIDGNLEKTYKKLIAPQATNEKGKFEGKDYDKTHISFESVNESDLIKFKKGEKYTYEDDYYYVTFNNKNIKIIDKETRNAMFELSYDVDKASAIVTNNKVLLQLIDKTTSESNYDIICDGEKYRVDTYEISLKDYSYKKIDNFEYFLLHSDIRKQDKGALVLYALRVSGNYAYDSIDLVVDDNLKVIQDSRDYIYDEEGYVDLENGYYLEDDGNGYVYFTDKNGIIKKAFTGYSTIISKGGVIILEYDGENRFAILDFKGNVISDKTYTYSSLSGTFLGNDLVYTDNITRKNHVMKFENGALVSNEEIDYSYYRSYANTFDVDSISTNTRYIEGRTYLTAEKVDTNGDNAYDSITCTFFDEATGEEFNEKIVNAKSIRLYNATDLDGIYKKFFYVRSNVEAESYTIAIYKLAE